MLWATLKVEQSYYEHETGTDQNRRWNNNCNNLQTYLLEILILHKEEVLQGQQHRCCNLRGDGEFIMKIRRFIPDFISQTGNTQVTLELRNFPNDTQASSSLGPFTYFIIYTQK